MASKGVEIWVSSSFCDCYSPRMFFPKRFTIYVLGDVLQLFVVMLVGLTSFIMLGLVLHFLISEDLGLEAFTRLLPYASVTSLQFAFPSSLLFAVCTVFGRLSADNEITAVKSVGVSPAAIIKPVLLVAFLLSPLAVWVIDLAVSWGMPGMRRVVMHSIEETVYRTLSKNRSYTSQAGLSIHVQDVKDRWLIKPTIDIYGSNGAPNTISAESARLSLNAKDDTLIIELHNYDSSNGDKWTLEMGDEVFVVEVPLFMAAKKNAANASASMIPLREIEPKKKELHSEQSKHQKELLSRCSMALASGRVAWLHDPASQTHRDFLNQAESKMQRLEAEPWRRWAQGFSCFCFAWLGIPLAIQRRSADYIATFGVCFLPILLLYYPLVAVGLDKSKSGDWHPASQWLANGVLLAVGAYFMRRVHRS